MDNFRSFYKDAAMVGDLVQVVNMARHKAGAKTFFDGVCFDKNPQACQPKITVGSWMWRGGEADVLEAAKKCEEDENHALCKKCREKFGCCSCGGYDGFTRDGPIA